MKQYLLLLKSSDFNKDGNVWTSNPINLYHNEQYKNYSNRRSAYGLNLVGDRTYVGTEVASPSYIGDDATPYSDTALYVTNVGEVVYEPATPSLVRFIDTTSKIDILSYRHTFTNVSGTIVPTMTFVVYESDTENGPWLKSSVSQDSGIIYVSNAKPFVKFEGTISAETIDLNTLGMLLYVEIGIHDPIPITISDTVRNIAKRFPTWTAIFEDSVDPATPALAVPTSTGGKFLTALLQENLERFNSLIELNDINSYINSANEDMLAWLFVSYNVPQNINLIFGDSIPLARVSNFVDLLDGRSTDYTFYYNPIDKQFITLRKYNNLIINNILYEQEPLNIFNDFDEFGVRVGLPRLNLESNSNYKKRILDVTANLPAPSLEGFKRTVRRELDLWRAYGATPDSNYLGATPEVLEISDIETTTPYFTESGKPEPTFRRFVDFINSKYPSNIGFARWNEAVWDYAGRKGEGVARVPAIYDTEASPIGQYYQSGVGDFDDLKLSMFQQQAATVSFNGYVEISGYKKDTNIDVYPPIVVDYSWYFGYLRTVSDTDANTVGVELVYEISMPEHDSYSTPSTFYANLNYNDRSDLYVTNRFLSTSHASPEFSYINIFNNDGLTEVQFRDKLYNEVYLNSNFSPPSNNIDIFAAASVNVIFGQSWDYETQSYTSLGSSEFRISFSAADSAYYVSPLPGDSMTAASPNTHPNDIELKIGSTKYETKQELKSSDFTLNSTIVLNDINELSTSGIVSKNIYTADLIAPMSIPLDAQPKFIYLQAGTPSDLSYYGSEDIVSAQGGISYDPISDTRYLVPASPNITWSGYGGLTTPTGYFNDILIDISATPEFIEVASNVNGFGSYPFKKDEHILFTASSTPNIFYGFVDEVGNVYKDESEYNNTFFVGDTYLSTIQLQRDTFALDETDYVIDSIKFIPNEKSINVYSVNIPEIINNLNRSFVLDSSLDIDLHASLDVIKRNKYLIGINTGAFFLREKDFYIYNEPITETFTGRFFNISLSNMPRMGAPVLVRLDDQPIREVIFENSATPGVLTFENTEYVKGNRGNSLFLAYENIENISVKDSYTGITLFSGLSSSTNQITPFSPATPAILGREYEVTYYVNDAFFVDKNTYNESTDMYESIVYFSSTPSNPAEYQITYENSKYNRFIDTELTVNQLDSPIYEGFIFIDDNPASFDTIEYSLSPNYIYDSGKDFMVMSFTSYDVNGNFKPNQTFLVDSANLDVVSVSDLVSINLDGSAYVTTNNNGFASIGLQYNGAYPASVRQDTVSITGLNSTNPNAHPNSECGSYSSSVPFEIIRSIGYQLEVKASPTKLVVEADGTTDVVIIGRVYWRGVPVKANINLGWNKARTLYDLFAGSPSNLVTTDSDGYFIISGQITAESNINPGHWFARIEILDSAEDIKLLLPPGEVTLATDITITGDVVYWNEKYDNVHFANEELPLPSSFVFAKQDGSDLIATPNFVYSHHDGLTVSNILSTPNWNPPKWVALKKFDQYQMGLFGSTPNYISDYSQVHPDIGEE